MINIREFLGLGFYTSELDQFLEEYEKNHPKLTLSQRKEVEKYARIHQLRDNPTQSEKTTDIWEDF